MYILQLQHSSVPTSISQVLNGQHVVNVVNGYERGHGMIWFLPLSHPHLHYGPCCYLCSHLPASLSTPWIRPSHLCLGDAASAVSSARNTVFPVLCTTGHFLTLRFQPKCHLLRDAFLDDFIWRSFPPPPPLISRSCQVIFHIALIAFWIDHI